MTVACRLQAESRPSMADDRHCAHLERVGEVDLLLSREARREVHIAAALSRGGVGERDKQPLERSCKGSQCRAHCAEVHRSRLARLRVRPRGGRLAQSTNGSSSSGTRARSRHVEAGLRVSSARLLKHAAALNTHEFNPTEKVHAVVAQLDGEGSSHLQGSSNRRQTAEVALKLVQELGDSAAPVALGVPCPAVVRVHVELGTHVAETRILHPVEDLVHGNTTHSNILEHHHVR